MEYPKKEGPSNGELFKKKYGFSKSVKRAMQKAGIDYSQQDALDLYRAARALKQEELTKKRQKKHGEKKALRGVKKKEK